METSALIERLQFDSNGLVPAIVQDARSGQVLMLAYMNLESLRITLEEGYACFYSRSRRTLWRKGESSGNTQRVVSIHADCDLDALVVRVIPAGPACHTGSTSCFFNSVYGESKEPFTLESLLALIEERKCARPEGSYTSYLFNKGREKILKKVGEESTEVIIGAMKGSREETVYEIADLAYHVLVLMAEMGVRVEDVRKELESRHVIDRKVKQETMA